MNEDKRSELVYFLFYEDVGMVQVGIKNVVRYTVGCQINTNASRRLRGCLA